MFFILAVPAWAAATPASPNSLATTAFLIWPTVGLASQSSSLQDPWRAAAFGRAHSWPTNNVRIA